MSDFRKLNLESSEEEIIKEIHSQKRGDSVDRSIYCKYLTKLLEIKQQKKILDEQNKFNEKLLKDSADNIDVNKNISKSTKWTAIAAFVATFASIGALFLSDHQFNKINRPYLAFDLSDVQFVAINENMNSFKLEATLNNVGNIPAKFSLSDIKNSGYNGVFWEDQNLDGDSKFRNGVAFPGQKIKMSWLAHWDSTTKDYQDWVKTGEGARIGFFPVDDISVNIEYCILNDKNFCNKEYHTNMIGSLGRPNNVLMGRSQFIWKIENAN